MRSSSSAKSAPVVAVEPVAYLAQAQELRLLRNQCRQYMTGSTAVITERQQREWFGREVAPRHVRAWLLRVERAAVAYALLRPRADGGTWLSCGVAENARGRGLGALIVRHAVTWALKGGIPVRLEVWADNTRARYVYARCGFTVIGEAEQDGRRLVVMEAR